VGVFRLEVADSGAGIAEEDHKNVFGEFAQFNRNELQGGGASSSFFCGCDAVIDTSVILGGSGLGLWISRRIINLHHVSYSAIYVHYSKVVTVLLRGRWGFTPMASERAACFTLSYPYTHPAQWIRMLAIAAVKNYHSEVFKMKSTGLVVKPPLLTRTLKAMSSTIINATYWSGTLHIIRFVR